MSIYFKIFFEKIKDEKVVLLKGDLLEFKWHSLKNKLIENSNNSFFQSKNLIIKNDDIICLNLEDKDKYGLKQDFFIYDNRTFIYLLEKLKKYQKKNQIEEMKIKFYLNIENNEPKIELANFDICLNESLKKIWKKEKDKIKKELSHLELTNSENNFVNKKLNKENNKNPNEDNDKKLKFNINQNVTCNNCLSMNFYGYRYICSYCNNYNLCNKCYHLGNHEPSHNFILFRNPLENDEDILKYDAKFNPSSIILRNIKGNPKITFTLANTGQNDLINCYIGCIKLDKNHLWRERYDIKENLKRNAQKKINELELKYDNEENNTFNIFEGHFRMFTEKGIPFGDILKIRIINELFD